jgi:hypothetical protein
MAAPDLCPNCGEVTETIGGRCPNCWYPKQPEQVPAGRRHTPSFFDDLDGVGLRLVLLSPGLAVALVGIATGSRVVLVIGGFVMAVLALLIRGVFGGL